MIKIAISLFFFFVSFAAEAQTTFFNHYAKPTCDRGFEVVETNSGSFLIVGERYDDIYIPIYRGFILEVMPDGGLNRETELVDSLVNYRFSIINRLPTDPAKFLVIGASDSSVGTDVYSSLVICSVNDSLEIISQSTCQTINNYYTYPWKTDFANDTIFYLVSEIISNSIPPSARILVNRIDLPSDILATYTSPEGPSLIPYDILYLKKTGRVSIFYIGSTIKSNGSNHILNLDTNLQMINTVDCPSEVYLSPSTTRQSDSTYYLTSIAKPTIPYLQRHIVTYLMNADHDTIKKRELYLSVDTVLYAGGGTNTAIIGSSVFVTGIYNIEPQYYPWQTTPTWIVLTKMTSDLEVVSQYFYGGDAEYTTYCIIPTSDGGTFTTGFMWDYNIPGNFNWEVFALKTDSNGTLASIPEGSSFQQAEAIICPNPGTEYFDVILAVQHQQALLCLYDLEGKPVMEKTLLDPRTRIDANHLTVGVYVYKITAAGKIIGSGKWVKR